MHAQIVTRPETSLSNQTLATQLRHQAPRVLDEPMDPFSQASPSRLAGYCYHVTEAYYRGVDDNVRERLTPKQVEISVEHHRIMETVGVSHWFLERDDGVIIDLTAEQFDFLRKSVPYDEATGRGFVPPSPCELTTQLLDVVDT